MTHFSFDVPACEAMGYAPPQQIARIMAMHARSAMVKRGLLIPGEPLPSGVQMDIEQRLYSVHVKVSAPGADEKRFDDLLAASELILER